MWCEHLNRSAVALLTAAVCAGGAAAPAWADESPPAITVTAPGWTGTPPPPGS